jgi:N-acetylmuramic acid 6-phosphate etherase
MRAGCAYFGVRIPRHAARDMDELAALGYTAVLHTFSENDLAHYRGTMAEIVAASHRAGLEVQASPWGLGGTFGGEAESRFVVRHPGACQISEDGRRLPAACFNRPEYRAFCREWADAALEAGVDYVFWDEPHWQERQGCRCDACRERGGDPDSSLADFLGELLAHVRRRGGRSTVCLLPLPADWDAVAALPGLDVLATDPYWNCFDEPAVPFVSHYAELVASTAAAHGVAAQLWVPSFRLGAQDIPDLEAAVAAARAAGLDDLWTWGFEACGHMSSLATDDAGAVWEAVTSALTGAGGARDGIASTERAAGAYADLDLRTTRELVETINDEDARVAPAVRRAAPALAAAIDAIGERLARGGRLVYVGAGSSGRLALVDAAECGPTFGLPPDRVVAIVAGGAGAVAVAQESAEDDADAGAADVAAAGIGPDDAVVGISASGRTPYVLAAVEVARAAGALTVALVGARESSVAAAAELEVAIPVGPEVIAGSTRMKAGTAQKLALNTISTVAMVQLGRTYGNLMVDVVASNEKLRARARRAVATASGASDDAAAEALEAADGDAKVAIVTLLSGVDTTTARSRLDAAGGALRKALAAS